VKQVRQWLSEAIDRAPAGPVRLVSLCAGQGRDVIGALPGHPRGDDVRAVLVEVNPRLAEAARGAATQAGLAQVEVREADAAAVASFADALPADVLLLCGIFGNVSDEDVERTIGASAAMCTPGATVIWTRHRLPPDLTPQIRAWFAASGFSELAFAAGRDLMMGLGANRLLRPGTAGLPDGPLFTFRG
jgi:hypothetical protein